MPYMLLRALNFNNDFLDFFWCTSLSLDSLIVLRRLFKAYVTKTGWKCIVGVMYSLAFTRGL